MELLQYSLRFNLCFLWKKKIPALLFCYHDDIFIFDSFIKIFWCSDIKKNIYTDNMRRGCLREFFPVGMKATWSLEENSKVTSDFYKYRGSLFCCVYVAGTCRVASGIKEYGAVRWTSLARVGHAVTENEDEEWGRGRRE